MLLAPHPHAHDQEMGPEGVDVLDDGGIAGAAAAGVEIAVMPVDRQIRIVPAQPRQAVGQDVLHLHLPLRRQLGDVRPRQRDPVGIVQQISLHRRPERRGTGGLQRRDRDGRGLGDGEPIAGGEGEGRSEKGAAVHRREPPFPCEDGKMTVLDRTPSQAHFIERRRLALGDAGFHHIVDAAVGLAEQ